MRARLNIGTGRVNTAYRRYMYAPVKDTMTIAPLVFNVYHSGVNTYSRYTRYNTDVDTPAHSVSIEQRQRFEHG